MATKTFWTIGRIAEHLGIPRHRVEYLIDSRRLEPVGRAGIARVFSDADVERIAKAVLLADRAKDGEGVRHD